MPAQAPFTFANTRVIAVGLSNGGGAVLRAAEDGEPWLDAVVAGEPNVLVQGHGARALYDYTTEAALLMPCALPQLGLPGTNNPSSASSASSLAPLAGNTATAPVAGNTATPQQRTTTGGSTTSRHYPPMICSRGSGFGRASIVPG